MVERIKKLVNFHTYLYLGMFVLSLVLLIFVMDKLINVKGEVIDIRTKIAKLDNDLSRLDKNVKERNENQDKLDKIKSSLPSSYREVAAFTQNIEQIAQNETETLNVTIDKTVKSEGDVNSLKFTLVTRGDYTSIKNTLNKLANSSYHTTIDSLKVEEDTGQLVTLTNFRLFMSK